VSFYDVSVQCAEHIARCRLPHYRLLTLLLSRDPFNIITVTTTAATTITTTTTTTT